MATQYKKYLDSSDSCDLQNIAYTAQFGRAEFKKRGYFLASRSFENQSSRITVSYLHDDEYWNIPQIFFVFLPVACGFNLG